jgi:hypothetical protein
MGGSVKNDFVPALWPSDPGAAGDAPPAPAVPTVNTFPFIVGGRM